MSERTDLLSEKLHRYVEGFNRYDEERDAQAIPNRDAESFLRRQIPLLDCPDPELEEMYYFRWWTFRKHWKQTEKGHILTEFLAQVPWSGPYNSINCPSGLHIREGRWLADPDGWMREYISFWLNGHGKTDYYSSWYAHALWEYCSLRGEWSFGTEQLDALIFWFRRREQGHLRPCGLYWSNDGKDGMEYSISGPGLRPTINAYAWADAMAISRFAALAGRESTAAEFREKAELLEKKIEDLLWDGDFYKTIPVGQEEDATFTTRPSVPPEHDVRELIGYVPWYFGLPKKQKNAAFRHLVETSGFCAPVGLTTAERRHPRFMEPHEEHECLWNGPVWPFATSQTLVAAANLLHGGERNALTKEQYYAMLLTYAKSQHRTDPSGRVLPWIDENLDPFTGAWLSRDILEGWGWDAKKGGFERGKDYNHSLFCDLVLSGLFGISADGDGIAVDPIVPDEWDHFMVENVRVGAHTYRIVYDRDGTHYGGEKGLSVTRLDI